MKTLLCFLAIVSAAFAATPIVTIDDNQNTFVDGSNFGKVGDVFVNHKGNAALIVAVNVALDAHIAKIKADAATAVAAAHTKAAADVAAANTAKGVADTAKATAEASRAAEAAKTAAIVAALKGVNQAILPAAVKAELLAAGAKEKAALQAQQAEIAAKLATMP